MSIAAVCGGLGSVNGRKALLVLEIRNFPHAAGFAVVAPAMIATLNPALLADAAQRQRGAPMRTAVLQGTRLSIEIAPQHDRTIADIHR
jgi:hypothetical protein